MSTTPPVSSGSTPVGPIADDASIHLLAEVVLDALSTGALAPSIVRFSRRGTAIELGMLPLDDAHPTGMLLGYTPDDDCFALGLAAHGWAYDVASRTCHHRDRTRVHLVSVVSRSGERAHVTRADDPDHPINDIDGELPSGEQVDLLRRAFDIPTEAPPCPTSTYWSIEWLAAVVDRHAERADTSRRLRWSEVTAVHPAASLLVTGGGDPGDHDFVDMTASFARVCDWPRIRTLVDSGGYDAAGLVAGDGDWFDDGSIARYLLSRCPPFALLRHEVRAVVTADADRRITEVLDAMGVPETVWPDASAA